MPYTAEHKAKTRKLIIESARVLFNRHGFNDVSIDMIMEYAGLTRGGFYNHFKCKDDLFAESVTSFLMGRGAQWREEAGIDFDNLNPDMAMQMVNSYLSKEHLKDIDGQCPMIALSSDIARSSDEVKKSYQVLLEAMVNLFQRSLGDNSRETALSLAAMCVGGMVLARTIPESELALEIQQTCKHLANDFVSTPTVKSVRM